MAHKCVRCERIYPSNSNQVLKGCICGSKLFIFIPDDKLDENDKKRMEKTVKELKISNNFNNKNNKTVKKETEGNKEHKKTKDKNYEKYNKIEEEIKKIFNIKKEEVLVLPLETIRIIDNGKFLIDINKLFQERVVVIKTKDGSYVLQIY